MSNFNSSYTETLPNGKDAIIYGSDGVNYIKFDDIREFLKPSTNSAMDKIAAIADTIEECFQVDGNELGLLQVNKLRQLRQ